MSFFERVQQIHFYDDHFEEKISVFYIFIISKPANFRNNFVIPSLKCPPKTVKIRAETCIAPLNDFLFIVDICKLGMIKSLLKKSFIISDVPFFSSVYTLPFILFICQ